MLRKGISQSGQEVTLAVAQSMGRHESSVCRMASASHTDVIPVDIGIAASCKIDGVLDEKSCLWYAKFCKRACHDRKRDIRCD